MIRLLYVSHAVPTTTTGDLKAILESARRNNIELGVTGLLVTESQIFLQILEGPMQSVLSLFLKISKDKRHHDVELLRVAPVKQRIFEAWSMAFIEATPLEFEQIRQFKAKYLAHGEPQEFTDTMRGLLIALQGQKELI